MPLYSAHHSLKECIGATLRSAQVSEDLSGNAKEPGQRVVRDIVYPSPRNLETPRQSVLSELAVGPSEQIGGYTLKVIFIEAFEPLISGSRHSIPL
jgi:hypothetical protein